MINIERRVKGRANVTIFFVLIVVGILAAFIIPSRSDDRRPHDIVHAGIASAQPLQNAVANYYRQHRNWPGPMVRLPVNAKTDKISRYVRSIALTPKGVIVIVYNTRKAKLAEDLTGQTVKLIPAVDARTGAISWELCNGGSVPTKFRSRTCRQN